MVNYGVFDVFVLFDGLTKPLFLGFTSLTFYEYSDELQKHVQTTIYSFLGPGTLKHPKTT